MYFPILINATGPFPFQGFWVVIFIFNQILKKLLYANSGEPDQTPRFAASDLVLHCLPMFHKRTQGIYGLTIPMLNTKEAGKIYPDTEADLFITNDTVSSK